MLKFLIGQRVVNPRLVNPGLGTLHNSHGFTLVEVLVAVSIVSVVVGMFGAGIFQVLSTQRFWTDDVKATKELRHAESWFAGDALNAEDIFDSGGVNRLTCSPSPSVDQVNLTWTDSAAVVRTVNYRLSGGALVREFDGNAVLVQLSPNVVPGTLSFSLCGNVVTLQMDVTADRGTTESLDIRTYMRKLS